MASTSGGRGRQSVGEDKIPDRTDRESSPRKDPKEVRELVVWPRQGGERFRQRREFQSVQELWGAGGPKVLKEKPGGWSRAALGDGSEDEVCHVMGKRGQTEGVLVSPGKGSGSLLKVK